MSRHLPQQLTLRQVMLGHNAPGLGSSTNGMIDHYSPVTINSGDQLAGLAQADAKIGAFKIVATHFGPQHTVERSVCNTQNSTMSS